MQTLDILCCEGVLTGSLTYTLAIKPRNSINTKRMPSDSNTSEIRPSRPRFDVTPYRPDEGCPVVGTAALYTTVIIAGGIAGWLVNRLMGKIGLCLCCMSGPVQLALLGYAIGGVGSLALYLGKVRSPVVAGMAGVLGMLASVFGQLFSEYQQELIAAQRMQNQNPPAMAQGAQGAPAVGAPVVVMQPADDFLTYLERIRIIDLFPLGIGFLLGASSCYALMASRASMPFDPIAEQWKDHVQLGRLRMPRAKAIQAIETGDLTLLANAELRQKGSGVYLSVFVSPLGAPQATVDMELEEVVRHNKHRDQRMKLGRWTYPGEAWGVLDYLFPGAIPLHVQNPDVEQAEERYE